MTILIVTFLILHSLSSYAKNKVYSSSFLFTHNIWLNSHNDYRVKPFKNKISENSLEDKLAEQHKNPECAKCENV